MHKSFPISFSYKGTEYKANAQKIPPFKTSPLQYHVTGFSPAIDVQSPIFVVNKADNIIEFGHDPSLPGIEYQIAEAIKDGCIAEGIELMN